VNIAIFGGFDKRPFAPGWTKQTAVAVLGGGEIDLTAAPPADGAVLTAVALFGAIEVVAPAGSRVTLSGLSLFGGRSVTVVAGDGPAFAVRAFAVFGGIEVKERAEDA
jgi:hypothetical protein